MSDRKFKCFECEDELIALSEPHNDENNEPLCENCYADALVECCICDESVPKWEVGRIGDLLAVTEQTGKILPGVYRILQHPYHWSSYLSGGLYADALTRLGDLTDEIYVRGGYQVGFICAECATHLP